MRVAHRILVVDNERSISGAVKDYFTAHGYDVDCAYDLQQAIASLDNSRYSVVIADLRLGGLDQMEGLRIVEYVRKNWPSMGVILLTAYGTPEAEAEAIRFGVDAFLKKPKPLSQIAQIVFGIVESMPEDQPTVTTTVSP
jgi:two-component system, NtrC family, response regulator GlrR